MSLSRSQFWISYLFSLIILTVLTILAFLENWFGFDKWFLPVSLVLIAVFEPIYFHLAQKKKKVEEELRNLYDEKNI
jgi:hypothetical protein